MAASSLLLLGVVVVSSLIWVSHGFIIFSSLQRTLGVSASTPIHVLKAGEDNLTVKWGLNRTYPTGTDSAYKTIKVKLCYAPVSQVDRAWRKTVDNLSKDKTCQFNIVTTNYNNTVQTIEWTVERDIPTGTYFVRAYAYNSEGHELAYGQTTDALKSTNLFEVEAISGRHASLDIASVCFSAFSVVSLFGFFFYEKRKAKNAQHK